MNKNFTSKLLIILTFFIISVGVYILSSTFLDNKINDTFTKIIVNVQNKQSSDNIVLIVIDNKSLKRIPWPWSKDLFSDMFYFLEKKAGAKAIIFQNLIVFPDTYRPNADNIFFKSLKKQNNLINSYILLNSNVAGDVLPQEYLSIFQNKSNVKIIDKTTRKIIPSYKAVIHLPKDFLLNTKFLASSVITEDKDEIVRNYTPVVYFNGEYLPSIALSAYAMYMGIDKFILYDDYLCTDDNCNTLKMPIYYTKKKDYIGNTIYGFFSNINWYKPKTSYYSYKKFSADDILISYYNLKNGKNSKIPLTEFKDKIIVIGLNADRNVWDQLSETQILKKQADIDVHATMINNMIDNSFKSINKNDYTLLITLIFSFFIVRGFRNFKNNILFTTMLSSIYFIYYLYEYFINVLVPPISPILTMYSVAILKNIYSIVTTDKTSEMLKHAMGKYVSKDVMKKVIADIDKLKLGGVRAVVTILFVDIRNFTQISEKLSPQEVSSILNEYFSTIEPIIGKYHGIVNKYMGDGLLAVFGEPIKNSQHAMNAIKCGIEIVDKVKILREKLILEGKPIINIGIGINTGEVFAGNIGTEERLEYTVIGDNVNLAYRIEAYNQILKTQFLISDSTYEFVKDYVDVVKLSQVSIKGKSKPIDIYEVLSIK